MTRLSELTLAIAHAAERQAITSGDAKAAMAEISQTTHHTTAGTRRAAESVDCLQAVTAFAPKIEAARPEDRGRLIDALIRTVAYHRVGDRPGRWEPRATKRRPKHGMRLMQPRADAKLPQNRAKYF